MKRVTHIEGRRWFQKTYGNTYHSVIIHFSDGGSEYLPVTYGYGDHYIETALQWLQEHNYLSRGKQYASGIHEITGSYGLRTLGITHSVADVKRKRDL